MTYSECKLDTLLGPNPPAANEVAGSYNSKMRQGLDISSTVSFSSQGGNAARHFRRFMWSIDYGNFQRIAIRGWARLTFCFYRSIFA